MNGTFAYLLKFCKLIYAPSSSSKSDFLRLIGRQFFLWHPNTFELEQSCKQCGECDFLEFNN